MITLTARLNFLNIKISWINRSTVNDATDLRLHSSIHLYTHSLKKHCTQLSPVIRLHTLLLPVNNIKKPWWSYIFTEKIVNVQNHSTHSMLYSHTYSTQANSTHHQESAAPVGHQRSTDLHIIYQTNHHLLLLLHLYQNNLRKYYTNSWQENWLLKYAVFKTSVSLRKTHYPASLHNSDYCRVTQCQLLHNTNAAVDSATSIVKHQVWGSHEKHCLPHPTVFRGQSDVLTWFCLPLCMYHN